MKNENSVCFVAKINDIQPILEADKIVLATIGGWNCIIPKDKYKINDLVIIATTDAVLPQNLVDLTNTGNYLRAGNRVRTIKLKGVYSECLVLELDSIKLVEGDDYMEKLNVFKYEPPVTTINLSSGKTVKYKSNNNFKVYHKFPNIKNTKNLFAASDFVEITRKIHGTNARYGLMKRSKIPFLLKVKKFFKLAKPIDFYEFVYGSHNVEKGSDSQGFYSTDVWKTIAEKYEIKNKLISLFYLFKQDIGSGIILYGEIFGPGIQKNYDYNLKEIEFNVFDLVINNEYMNMALTCRSIQDEKLPYVEILYAGYWTQEMQDRYTFNNFIEGTKIPHEGIVIKHVSGARNKVAKVINPDYLIYSEKHKVGDSH